MTNIYTSYYARTKVCYLSNLIIKGKGIDELGLTEQDKTDLSRYNGPSKYVLGLKLAVTDYDEKGTLTENTKKHIHDLIEKYKKQDAKKREKRRRKIPKICTYDGAHSKLLQLSDLIAKGKSIDELGLTEQEKIDLNNYTGGDKWVLT